MQDIRPEEAARVAAAAASVHHDASGKFFFFFRIIQVSPTVSAVPCLFGTFSSSYFVVFRDEES